MSTLEPIPVVSPHVDSGSGRASLQRLGVLLLLVYLPFVAFWPSTLALAVRWEDIVHRTYTHGYLVLAISAWMLWRDRIGLAREAPRPFYTAVAIVFGLVLFWLVAFRAGIQIAHQSILPLVSWAAVLACFGWPLARRVILPVGYLYFAVPVWDAVNSTLQEVSVFAVRQLLKLAGVPAHFVGNTFQIPEGSFEIADGCSGLHFMVVALAIGVLYGEVNREGWRNRIILVLMAGAMAALTNWVRIFVIVMAGHLTDMQHYLIRGEHYNFGWMMFAGMMVLFFLLARVLPPSVPAPEGLALNASPHRGYPVSRSVMALVLGAVVFAPASIYLGTRTAPTGSDLPLLPVKSQDWREETPRQSTWHPRFVGADEQLWKNFIKDGQVVEAFAARYWQQSQGRELAGFENVPFGEGTKVMSTGALAPLPLWNESRVRDAEGREWVVWSAYLIEGSWFTSSLRAQIYYGWLSLFSSPSSTAVLLRTGCQSDCASARLTLAAFSAGGIGPPGGNAGQMNGLTPRSTG
jgi:exosortase A